MSRRRRSTILIIAPAAVTCFWGTKNCKKKKTKHNFHRVFTFVYIFFRISVCSRSAEMPSSFSEMRTILRYIRLSFRSFSYCTIVPDVPCVTWRSVAHRSFAVFSQIVRKTVLSSRPARISVSLRNWPHHCRAFSSRRTCCRGRTHTFVL